MSNKTEEPVGFVSAAGWLKCLQISEITTAAILSQFKGKLPPKRIREFISETIFNLLLESLADPQMLLLEKDDKCKVHLDEIVEHMGNKIKVKPQQLYISDRFITDDGINCLVD